MEQQGFVDARNPVQQESSTGPVERGAEASVIVEQREELVEPLPQATGASSSSAVQDPLFQEDITENVAPELDIEDDLWLAGIIEDSSK